MVTTNFNSTNPNDMYEEEEPIDSQEVDFLQRVGYYNEEEQEEEELASTTMGDDSQSITDFIQYSHDLSLGQHSRYGTHLTDTSVKKIWVLSHSLYFPLNGCNRPLTSYTFEK